MNKITNDPGIIENDVCSKTHVFGLEDSFEACKYSFAVDVDNLPQDKEPLLKCAKTPIGSGHDNALNGIVVQFDLSLTSKAWVEAERYHFFDFVMSQSTMHKITKFDLDKAFNEYTGKYFIDGMKELVYKYNNFDWAWETIYKDDELMKEIEGCEEELKKDFKNALYLTILYSCPAGLKLTARMTTNYRQLRTIYHQRQNHRLPEWHSFCEWVESLPMAKELICNVRTDS